VTTSVLRTRHPTNQSDNILYSALSHATLKTAQCRYCLRFLALRCFLNFTLTFQSIDCIRSRTVNFDL